MTPWIVGPILGGPKTGGTGESQLPSRAVGPTHDRAMSFRKRELPPREREDRSGTILEGVGTHHTRRKLQGDPMTYRFNLISIVFGLCLLFLAGSALAGPASAASPPTKAATPSETAPPAASEGTPQSATPAAKDRAI